MAAFRFWRLDLISSGLARTLQITTCRMYGADGVTDLPTLHGGTPGASGWANSDYTPNYAFDADDVYHVGFPSCWGIDFPSVAVNPCWLQWDFGEGNAYEVLTVTQLALNASFTPQLGIVYASADGVTWTQMSEWQVFDTTNTSTAQAITVSATPIPTTARATTDTLNLGAIGTTWPPAQPHVATPPTIEWAGFDAGPGVVSGTVDINATPLIPVSRRVRLHARNNGRVLAETWSDAVTGDYSFDRVPLIPVYLIAFDFENNYNAVIKDLVLPEVPA